MLAPTTDASAGTADSRTIISFGEGNVVYLSAALSAGYTAQYTSTGGTGEPQAISSEGSTHCATGC